MFFGNGKNEIEERKLITAWTENEKKRQVLSKIPLLSPFAAATEEMKSKTRLKRIE